MKVILENGEAYPSTDIKVLEEHYGFDIYNTRWEILVNKAGSAEGVLYETTQTLSTMRGEIMNGRATLVWNVIPKNPTSSPVREADFYDDV